MLTRGCAYAPWRRIGVYLRRRRWRGLAAAAAAAAARGREEARAALAESCRLGFGGATYSERRR